MRIYRSIPGLPLAIALLFLVPACSDDDGPTGPAGELPERDTVFAHTWNGGDLSAMAYDPLSDNLFLIEDVHGGDNVIHRWSFQHEEISEVHRYTSQHDYGMRVIGPELWIARTYDESFRRLTDLREDQLRFVEDYGFRGVDSPATEVGDLAFWNGDIVFVTSNPLTSDQYDGIQVLEGPDFDSIREMLDEASAGWEPLTSAAWRSVVVLGQGPSARVAVTTGSSDGALVVYDTAGNEQFRAEGFGRSYLQVDSQGRLYAMASTGEFVRWSSDFGSREDFVYDLPSSHLRFVLRETHRHVELIYGEFRSDETEI